MKKILSLMVFVLFFVSLPVLSQDTEYYSYSYARLSYVNGDVFIQRAGDNGFEEGDVNLPMVEGDKIGTREGRAEIHFGKKNYLRIDRQTQLDLIELPEQGSDVIQLHMLSGDIFLRINYLEREKDFEIHTPDASFYILEEGLYRFVVRENVQTEVLVYEGMLEAAGQEGSVVVEENESLFASDGVFSSESRDYYTEYDDSFSNWSSSRDELQSRYVAKRYLPSELYEYETELAYNGRWAYEASYGYVWIPRVRYSYWRPYNFGRWVWYPIIGWTWVSSHSWGWCTSRYGRWQWRSSWGWYWIPTRRWGPGWVHWHHGYNYYAWSPLSYWNRPGVIINNHYYGRNNDRYYPGQSRALTVIHKNQLQARNISRVALSQDKIGQIGKISLSSKQPNVRSVVDRTSARYSTASKVLSRTNLRQVNKSYSSEKTVNALSRVRPTSIRKSSSSLENQSVIKRPSSRMSSTKTGVISKSGISARSIKRYSPNSQKSVTSRSSTTQAKRIAPSRFKSSAQSEKRTTPVRSVVTRRIPSSSTRSTGSERSSSSKTKSIIKRFSSSRSQAPSRSSSTQKSTTSKKNSTAMNSIRKFSSTSSSASSRGRAATAPSRSSVSSRSSSSRSTVRRPSSSSVQRSTPRTPSRSSVTRRSTPSRSSSSSRSTVSRSSRSSSPSRSTISRSSRSSSSSRSTISRSSRSSSSSRSSRSSSSSSKRIKKK